MGIFGKKKGRPVEEWLAEYPVRPETEHLLTLGVPLIERDAKENGSFILADPRQGKGAKYLFPMWGITGATTLETTIGELVDTSRSPKVNTGAVHQCRAKAAKAFEEALGGTPLPGFDFSPARIESVTDLGGMHLEYAAYLVRLEMGMPWGQEAHAAQLLEALHGEVRQRFGSWSDYMISTAVGDGCVEVPFGMPSPAPAYVRVARQPQSYFAKYPLGR